jgi:hypothetical protein
MDKLLYVIKIKYFILYYFVFHFKQINLCLNYLSRLDLKFEDFEELYVSI